MTEEKFPAKRLILPAKKLRRIRSCFWQCPHSVYSDCGDPDRCKFRSRRGRVLSPKMKGEIPSWCPLPDVEEDKA